MADLTIPHIANSPDKVQLQRISHVYFEHSEINEFENFAADFGFTEAGRRGESIYYRGYGIDPYAYVATKPQNGQTAFKGGAFIAQSKDDFIKATQIPGAMQHDLSSAPGGGVSVTIPTPGGSMIHIIWGQEEREVSRHSRPADLGRYNTALEKFRKGEFQRFEKGPAMVHKLGHYGFVSDKFDEDVRFYTSHFNFVPSDILYAPENEKMDVLVFLHLCHGTEYTDHHSLFFQRAPGGARGAMHHCSFEVDDFDTQFIGHEFLLARGHEPVWGVGRHVLGSQVFDYWKDSSGFVVEHYADGDLVNKDTKASRQEAGPQSLSIWGPALPPSFTG